MESFDHGSPLKQKVHKVKGLQYLGPGGLLCAFSAVFVFLLFLLINKTYLKIMKTLVM